MASLSETDNYTSMNEVKAIFNANEGENEKESEKEEVENNPFQRETDEIVLGYIDSQNKQSFLLRNFKPVAKGGIRSSVFTLFSSAVGAGILSLPKVVSMYGVLLGAASLFAFALVSYRMHTIIWELVEESGKRTYANLFSHYYSKNTAKVVIQFFIFAQFASLILYSAVSWSFLSHLLKASGWVDFPYKDEKTQEIDERDPLTVRWRYATMAGMALFILPVNCTRNLAALRYLSMGILLIVLYTILVAIVQFPHYYEQDRHKPDYKLEWLAEDYRLKWFQGWGTMMLSYNCQITLFYVRGELMHKTPERTRKISRVFMSILFVFYASIAVTGYLSLGANSIPKIFTLRKKIDPDSSDFAMQLAQGLFLFAALFHVPITLFPSREQFYLFYKVERTTKLHFGITALMTLAAFAIPCVYPDITGILGLLGGLTVGSTGYLLPTLLKLASLSKLRWFAPYKLAHILLALTIFSLQVMSIYVSIFKNN